MTIEQEPPKDLGGSSNYPFLEAYQRMQDSLLYDELLDMGYAVIGYSQTDPTPFSNFAVVGNALTDEQINEIESKFASKSRQATLYFDNDERLEGLKTKLKDRGYTTSFEESWQFWEGNDIDKKYFESVKKVTTEEELATFIQVCNTSYQNDDPQNPYGEMSDYFNVVKNAWYKHHDTGRIAYFLVYNDGQPVAVSTLTSYKGIGYISNVGSIADVRGQGFGKAATLYCVNQSIQNGNSVHCLATEEGQYPNEFYKRIGFISKFSATAYTKSTAEFKGLEPQ